MEYTLPKTVNIDGEEYEIRADFRVILTILELLGDRELSGDQLRNELLTSPPLEKVLIIRADRKVPTGVLSGVMAIAEGANMETFIAVSAPASGREMRFE